MRSFGAYAWASAAALSVLFVLGTLCACIFDTRQASFSGPSIKPDLPIGGQWMYVAREFIRPASPLASGNDGDTTLRYIHYSVPGDTSIAGATFRLLLEEDLALYNTDQGLVIKETRFAVRDSSGFWIAKRLRGVSNTLGRLPLKRSAFDTLHYEDEILPLVPAAAMGQAWNLRDANSPAGYGFARKAYLGPDTLLLHGVRTTAYKFAIEVQGQEYIRRYEWYDGKRKIFSLWTNPVSGDRADSSHTEEEYLGQRDFTAQDTMDVAGPP